MAENKDKELTAEERLAQLEAENASLKEVISEQNDMIDAQKNEKKTGKIQFTRKKDKKKYQVDIPKFNIPGAGVFTADDLKQDKKAEIEGQEQSLIDYLISIGSGVIKEV